MTDPPAQNRFDVAIVGGGIVGLATAWQIQNNDPDRSVVVLEKEREVAFHQTGRNSGVLHTGIYYKPGSLRATNCREGKLAMQQFCAEHDIPFDLCGKVIVALDETEASRLDNIFERGQANGVQCEMISGERLREIEPHAAGLKAIHVPEAGIVDYKAVSRKLAELICERNGEIRFDAKVVSVSPLPGRVVVRTPTDEIEADRLITCAGLQSDRVAKLSGTKPNGKIVPFRGEYFELKPDAEHLVKGLIYPTPDPRFPFLGVHFTRMIQGGVECGPNAVLAFAREGYHKTDINLFDLFESLTYPGFLRMAARHWKTGCGEMWRSFSKRAFVKALKRLVPEIESEQLVTAPAGVRAQLLARDGNLVDDFSILESERIINVCNAPSPAATASLNIGKLVAQKVV
ncbi:MAG TPA: L-2-hydroxyglutarate oxidase [Planctomycetaceae bacterium]|nr:L-2-hydroxyglutarate oxidase [Planctomycetaceae bacterium]